MASLLLGALVLGWLLASGIRGPRPPRAAHGLDRRLRWVERHPGEVDTPDIERLLLRQGLSPADVRLVTDRATALGIRPFTMWMWVKAYGARELAVAVAGDLPHDELLEHLGEGTLPDFHELEVLAGLNGLDLPHSGTWPPGVRPQVRLQGDRPAPRRLPPGWDAFFDDLAV